MPTNVDGFSPSFSNEYSRNRHESKQHKLGPNDLVPLAKDPNLDEWIKQQRSCGDYADGDGPNDERNANEDRESDSLRLTHNEGEGEAKGKNKGKGRARDRDKDEEEDEDADGNVIEQ